MKKRLITLFVCILSVIGVFGVLAACSGKHLDAPENVRIATNDGNPVIMWSEVENAKTYEVEINGDIKKTRRTEMEMSRFNLDNGTYTVRIRACATGFSNSAWSSATFEKSSATGLIYQEYVPGEYAVTSIGGAAGAIKIDDEYNDLPVTYIGDGAFAGSNSVTSIELGKNVRGIGTRAFGNCSFLSEIIFVEDGALSEIGLGAFQSCIALTSIELPNTVKAVGGSAFAYCRGLSDITFNENFARIGDYAFNGCESLKQLVIPKNVTYIGVNAFAECTGLKGIAIDSKSVVISSYAFSKCGSVIDENNPLTDDNKLTVDLGDGISSIGNYAFQSCLALDSIVVSDSVKSLGAGAFGGCSNLANVSLGSGLEYVGGSVLRGTKLWNDADNYLIVDKWLLERKNVNDTNGNLRTLDVIGIAQAAFAKGTLTSAYILPDSLIYINDNAFQECKMSSVTVGNNVKEIGDYAFYSCEYLKTVVLGNSVEVIGDYVFAKCTQLTAKSSITNTNNVNIPRSVKRIGAMTFWNTALWNSSTDILVVDNWVVGCKKEVTGALELPSGTVGISDYAFNECEGITGVYMPSTVENIGEAAFYQCKALKNIVIPSAVKEIKTATFYYCDSLTSVTIPSGLEVIGDFAFRTCSNLTKIEIPDSVTEIGAGAFLYCDRLSDVKLGSAVEKIGEYAFAYCVSLKEIELPDSLIDISSHAFYRSSALAEVRFGNGVRSIGDHAFYQCTMLSEIDMPDNITSIGDYAFYKCKALWKLKIGNNVQSVGDYAFYECYNLIKVVIPDSVEHLGDYAFMNCFGLDSVTLGVNLTSVGKHVFMNARKLTVYAESSRAYSTWDKLWNSQFRPVLWGCELSADKSYVESVKLGENTLSNGNAENGLFAPTRLGWTFVGWATVSGGESKYTAEELATAPNGTTLYAVWENTETKPTINVQPEYYPGWDTDDSWKRPVT